MDKVTYTKTTLYSFLKLHLFSKTETYSELSGDTEKIEIVVKPEYYNREFDIKDKDNNGWKGIAKRSYQLFKR